MGAGAGLVGGWSSAAAALKLPRVRRLARLAGKQASPVMAAAAAARPFLPRRYVGGGRAATAFTATTLPWMESCPLHTLTGAESDSRWMVSEE